MTTQNAAEAPDDGKKGTEKKQLGKEGKETPVERLILDARGEKQSRHELTE